MGWGMTAIYTFIKLTDIAGTRINGYTLATNAFRLEVIMVVSTHQSLLQGAASFEKALQLL